MWEQSIKVISPSTSPRSVKNSPALLEPEAVGWTTGRGGLGTTFCLRFFPLPFDFLDMNGKTQKPILRWLRPAQENRIVKSPLLVGEESDRFPQSLWKLEVRTHA